MLMIMVEEVGRFSIFSGFAINWEEEEAVKRISAQDYLVSLFRGKEAISSEANQESVFRSCPNVQKKANALEIQKKEKWKLVKTSVRQAA